MKIGLGITTTIARAIHPGILKYTSPDIIIHVHTDTDGIGVAKSRNNAIKYLYDQGCDYIAIMDDDVQIMASGWLEYAVSVMRDNDLHCIGLPNVLSSSIYGMIDEYIYWSNWIGAFHLFTREFIDEVGYFCTAFNKYGFEDAHLQYRYRLYIEQQQTRFCGFPCPVRLPSYLISEDVYGMNPPSSFTNQQKQEFINENRSIFERHVESKQIYYPYCQE